MDRRHFLVDTASMLCAPWATGNAQGQDCELIRCQSQPPGTSQATGGTYRQLGTQTLADFLRTIRRSLPEGLGAANTRLKPEYGILAYCGATIWRNRYSLGVAGGHGDSHDDGHYAQDLVTGRWEMLLGPSDIASATAVVDASGEWLPNRPASQHSYHHLVTVGDDIVQGFGYAIGNAARASVQAHRWVGASRGWQRYGTGGNLRFVPHTVLHDAVRNRIVRFPHENGRTVDVIPADDPNAAWVTITTPFWPAIGIYASIGYHPDLDSYVLIDQKSAPGKAWAMDAQFLEQGWRPVTVEGSMPAGATNPGLEYVPPLRGLAAVNRTEPDTLYYLSPTGGRLDPWKWTREQFSGRAPAGGWEVNGGPIAPFGRVKWSPMLNGLVVLKSALAPTEVFTPAAVASARR